MLTELEKRFDDPAPQLLSRADLVVERRPAESGETALAT